MNTSRILILDDDAGFRKLLCGTLGVIFRVDEAADEAEFRVKFGPFRYDLVLLDMRLSVDREGIDVLRYIYSLDSLQPVIMVSDFGNADAAIEAVDAGASMFLHKREFTPGQLIRMAEAIIQQGRLRREVQSLRHLAWEGEPDYLIGQHTNIREARERIQYFAANKESVPLVAGERGTGTTLVSRMIHRYSNCKGSLVEVSSSEFVERVTQAGSAHEPDSWSRARDGTLVLDRIETRKTEVQAWINSNRGGSRFDPRIVLLSHVSEPENAKDDVTVRLPPLRERRRDIPLLTNHFLHQQRLQNESSVSVVDEEVMDRFENHAWAGNIRELKNAIELAVIRASSDESQTIETKHLPLTIADSSTRTIRGDWNYQYQISRAEVDLVNQAVTRRGIRTKTKLADELGYSDRFTLLRRVRRALADHPQLRQEFPSVAELFSEARLP
jgi:DNA-binding NtrC family response regulator